MSFQKLYGKILIRNYLGVRFISFHIVTNNFDIGGSVNVRFSIRN